MANMAYNYAQCPGLVNKLRTAGALHHAVLHDYSGRQIYDGEVLDCAKCSDKDLLQNAEDNLFPISIDTENQIYYASKYVPCDFGQWQISLLLKDEIINCMAIIDMEEEEPDMWQFKSGEEISTNSFELERVQNV